MAEAKITLDSGPLNAATAALEKVARLYEQAAKSQERLGHAAHEHEQRHGGHGGAHGGPGAAGRYAQRLAQSITGARPAQGPVAEMAGEALERAEPLIEELGPVGIAAGLLVTAFGALEETARKSAEALAELHGAMLRTGGTEGETSRLASIGLGPGQQTAAAAGLRQRLGSDPFAMMEAGFRMDPRFGGPQNMSRDLLQQLDILHQMGPGEAQLLRARRLGLDAMLEQVNVSNDVWQQETKIAEAREQLMGSGQAATDLTARYRILGDQTQLLGMQIGVRLMPMFNTLLDWVNNALGALNGIPGMGDGEKGKNPLDEHKEAVEKNTSALDDLRVTMGSGRSTTGGGALAHGIPTALRGDEWVRARRAGAYRMGAFGS